MSSTYAWFCPAAPRLRLMVTRQTSVQPAPSSTFLPVLRVTTVGSSATRRMCRSTFWERRNTQKNEALSPLSPKKERPLSVDEFNVSQKMKLQPISPRTPEHYTWGNHCDGCFLCKCRGSARDDS